MFIARNKRFSNYIMRFDVIAIEGPGGETIEWIKDAFRPINSTL
jgi:Holliday junction resolvase-like predicted endonuclease